MPRMIRLFPFNQRRRGSLLIDILCGAAGGALGTLLMGPVVKGASKLDFVRQRNVRDQPQLSAEPATEVLARKALSPLGVPVAGERKVALGHIIHWSYGTVWGAIHGALHRRVPLTGRLFGLGFGVGLFLFGNELMLPVLRLTPKPNQVPATMHLTSLAAHLVYASTAEGTYRLLRRAFTS